MKTVYPNYQNSILNVSATILKHYGVTSPYDSIQLLENELNKNPKHVMLVLLDGLGVNIIKKNTSKDSLFRTLMKAEITSVFPPTTVAATTSVISGLPPYSHGHIGWTQYNKKDDSNTVVFMNEDFYDKTKVLKENFQRRDLSYETIFTKIKRANPNLHVYEVFPSFRDNGFDTFKAQVDHLINVSKGKASFSYCYWVEPDKTIHETGTKDPQLTKLIGQLEKEVKRLITNVAKDTLVVLIADHGLVDVKPININNEQTLLETLRRMPSVEPRACAFYLKDGMHEAFKNEFKKLFKKNFILLTRKEFLETKLLGDGVKHPLLNEFIGDYMAIAKSNYMIQLKEVNQFKAHHAGLLKDEMMVPLIMHYQS